MGAITYVAVLAIALVITFRVGQRYQRSLRTHSGAGLVGFDAELTERYARHPGEALRESVFTRAWTLVFTKHENPEVEQARRAYAICVLSTAAFAIFGLVLL
jgi:hypothetical protein